MRASSGSSSINGAIRFVGVAILFLVTPNAVLAVCSGSSVNFTQYYNKVVSPGDFTPESMVGSFWALGFGNPELGAGIDNGSFSEENWIVPYAGNPILFGDWSESNTIDGCIDGRIAPGRSAEIMVVELADRRSLDSSFFAVAAVARDRSSYSQFDFSAGIGRDITLAPVVKPSIVSSSRAEPNSVQLVVSGPTTSQLAAGFYTDGSVAIPEVLVGYRLYEQSYVVGGPIPDVRREVGWIPVTGTVPIGELSNVILDCISFRWYLAYSLVYESGFESPYVSAKSTQIQCGTWCIDDADGDGWPGDSICPGSDCDPYDPNTHPHAIEINDGKDNQCPGDPGFGIVDEVDGTLEFTTPGDKTTLSWPAQGLATEYEVARSSDPTMMTGCAAFPTASPSITDPVMPSESAAFYYVVRATAPHTGSWGRTSAGVERSTLCP